MKYYKHIKTYLILSLILIQCTEDDSNIDSNDLENIKTSQVIELYKLAKKRNVQIFPV